MFFHNKLSKNKTDSARGFTIIELLVVVSIIVILSGLVLVNYKPGREQFALQRTAHKIAQDLRRIQEMAMSAKEIGPTGDKIYPDGGFGIHFDVSNPGQYVLFADCNNNQTLDDNVCGASFFPETLDDGLTLLESKVQINELSTDFVGPLDSLDITFNAPDPTVFITGNAVEAEIKIFLGTSGIKIIKVNKAGLITVE